jgi:hypothetical protein
LNTVTLGDVFFGLAKRWGERTALVSPHLTLSYSEVINRAAQTARELRSLAGNRHFIVIKGSCQMMAKPTAVWPACRRDDHAAPELIPAEADQNSNPKDTGHSVPLQNGPNGGRHADQSAKIRTKVAGKGLETAISLRNRAQHI